MKIHLTRFARLFSLLSVLVSLIGISLYVYNIANRYRAERIISEVASTSEYSDRTKEIRGLQREIFSLLSDTLRTQNEYIQDVLLSWLREVPNIRLENKQIEGVISAVTERMKISNKSVELTLTKKINAISNQLFQNQKELIELKQALNPLKPEEIVTLVRLKDELSIVRKDLDNIKVGLAKDHDTFKTLIEAKIDAADKSTNLIFVVLLPMVLNFVYSFYKDRKESREKIMEERIKEAAAAITQKYDAGTQKYDAGNARG